jgi:hypothetical protein
VAAAPAAQAQAFEGTPMQRYVAALWRGLLGGAKFGLHDSFFEAGGHSLLAMQLITQVRKDGAASLEMTDLFEVPTVAALAERLEQLGMRPPERDEDPAGAVVPAPVPVPAPTPAPTPAPATAPGTGADLDALVAEIGSLSDDEVRARLAELDGEGQR